MFVTLRTATFAQTSLLKILKMFVQKLYRFQEATGHAQKAHPDSTSHKVIVDNTENTTEVFKLVLAQCYDTLEDADKDMVGKFIFAYIIIPTYLFTDLQETLPLNGKLIDGFYP
jgi:hypothetical protein